MTARGIKLAAVLGLVALAAVCATAFADSSAAKRGPAQGWPYSCGGPGYPLSLFDEPPGAENGDNPASRALRQLIRHPNGIETLPSKGWRRGGRESDRLDFVARRPGAPSGLFEVIFERDRSGEWSYTSSSHYCALEPYLVDQRVGRWTLDPDFPDPQPDDTEIHVLAEGSYCASGQPPRITSPMISFGHRRLVIASVENPPDGKFNTCEGTPPIKFTFELESPIGERAVLDAHHFPFEKRADLRP
jgi:hypothetical protein